MPEPHVDIHSTRHGLLSFGPQGTDLHGQIACPNRHHKSGKLRLIAEERASSLESN